MSFQFFPLKGKININMHINNNISTDVHIYKLLIQGNLINM